MMTLHPIASPAQAVSYYEADDYYAAEGQDRCPSAWYGSAAEGAGLIGEVDREVFRGVLEGRLPGGAALAGGQHGDRRPGWDCTFSAPKSVSLQALVGGDDRLVDAHEAAVCDALSYLERELVGYRETHGGEAVHVPSNRAVAALFRHEVSRGLDPQLHTHAVLVNAVQRADGDWRCLDARQLYAEQMTVGAVYRASLAGRARELGYEIRVEHSDGRFELAHITRAQVEAFSTRRADIEDALRQRGREVEDASPRERELAALLTREVKGDFDRAALLREWEERARSAGVSFEPIEPSVQSPQARRACINAAVDFAVAHETERSAVVTRHRLVGAAIGYARGMASVDEVLRELDARVKSGLLVRDGDLFTTEAAQAMEKELLKVAAAGRGAVLPVMAQGWFTELEDNPLNAGQRDAARHILTSSDRVIGVNGWAGTGKTTLLAHVVETATERGYRVLGVAPSAAAARELERAGVGGETIAAFLSRTPSLDPSTIVIVDEAGMVGARDMHGILSRVEAAGARAVLVGDVGQLKAVSAGAPFEQLQAQGLATVRLTEIVRQRNVELGAAVERAAAKDVRTALSKLAGHTEEISEASKRWQKIAHHYRTLTPNQRASTLVLTGTRRARDEINGEIRRLTGIAGTGYVFDALRPLNLTQAETQSTAVYTPGLVVIPHKNYKALGLMRGEQAEVVAVAGGRVELRRPSGDTVHWQPATASKVGVFERVPMELAQGDRVRVTANDHGRALANGEFYTITSIDVAAKHLTIASPGGREVVLPSDRALHLEHGYASTVHSVQGATSDRVIIDACTRSACAHASSFYVAISRARDEAWIYTDDRDGLPQAMSRDDRKAMALDVGRSTEIENGMVER